MQDALSRFCCYDKDWGQIIEEGSIYVHKFLGKTVVFLSFGLSEKCGQKKTGAYLASDEGRQIQNGPCFAKVNVGRHGKWESRNSREWTKEPPG